MNDTKYTEEQIEWAAPIFGELGNSVVDKIKKDKPSLVLRTKTSGKLTSKESINSSINFSPLAFSYNSIFHL